MPGEATPSFPRPPVIPAHAGTHRGRELGFPPPNTNEIQGGNVRGLPRTTIRGTKGAHHLPTLREAQGGRGKRSETQGDARRGELPGSIDDQSSPCAFTIL